MDKPLVVLYKGYVLECSAHRMAEGQYLAQVTISKRDGSVTLEQTSWSQVSPVHATRERACDWALEAAKAWVDAYS